MQHIQSARFRHPPHFKLMNYTSYWKTNLRYLAVLLAIWFAASYGFGILLAPVLNEFRFAGFPLGFWFAQQGSIYVFVILIFVYVRLMNRLDAKFGLTEQDEEEA